MGCVYSAKGGGDDLASALRDDTPAACSRVPVRLGGVGGSRGGGGVRSVVVSVSAGEYVWALLVCLASLHLAQGGMIVALQCHSTTCFQ